MAEDRINALEAFSAIQKMRDTQGWKLFLERYSKKGDEILTKILQTDLYDEKGNLIPPQFLYTKRDLYVHQLEILGTVAEVLNEFELEAKNADVQNREKKHIGV